MNLWNSFRIDFPEGLKKIHFDYHAVSHDTVRLSSSFDSGTYFKIEWDTCFSDLCEMFRTDNSTTADGHCDNSFPKVRNSKIS